MERRPTRQLTPGFLVLAPMIEQGIEQVPELLWFSGFGNTGNGAAGYMISKTPFGFTVCWVSLIIPSLSSIRIEHQSSVIIPTISVTIK